LDPFSKQEINNMNKEIDQLLASEEVMWKQRYRKSFLKEGDRKFLPYTGFN